MAYDGNSIIWRATNADDPTTAGYVEMEMYVTHLLPSLRSLADAQGYWGGRRERNGDRIWTFDVEAFGFSKRANDPNSDLQDSGVLYSFMQMVLDYRNLFLYATYESAIDHSLGPIQRALVHQTGFVPSSTNANKFYEQSVTLPMLVFIPDDLDPQESDGIIDLSFTVEEQVNP